VRELVRAALRALDIRRLVLGVHDAALPGDPRDDVGRGAPLSAGGQRLLRFVHDMGFDGLQLGPQGETTEIDPSPYDGTIFSRSTLSIALLPLVERGWLSRRSFDAMVGSRPTGADLRTAHRHAFAVQRRAIDEAFQTARVDLQAFEKENAEWLDRDSLYAALSTEHATSDWLSWPEFDRRLYHPEDESAARARREQVRARHRRTVDRYLFAQWVAHEQHAAFHARARELGLLLYGDLQIGLAHQDVWSWGSLFLPGYRMGAPPSRTNPEGQPWNYAVLAPSLYGTPAAPGPALRLLQLRVDKLLAEMDGLRVDHPHGLIDPWVYRAAQTDQLRAVQSGARLFSSPDLPDHPELAALSIAQPAQIDRALPRHADGWVRELRDDQVARYAVLFDAAVAAAAAHGRDVHDLIAEVLSTQPHPVGRVLARHGLGRFRVTQKVALDDPRDVYRSENAQPQDWILAGNHDTEPIWRVADRWVKEGKGAAHAAYLAQRLVRNDHERGAWAARIATDPSRLAQAKLAELFVGPARNAMIFFPDLLGMREVYNRPGTVNDENWSLRVPPDFEVRHREGAKAGTALDLRGALAVALRAREGSRELIDALEAR
jgi:4-alpha-glucanotransferase